ncbi:hypothetical protein [Marixanthomonas ophiurae]|uniref:Uncharacterized protein n=1 Tax=Marixanthomonas ophiurae TaxID=387659 RepID=A0A3E1QCF1_9FLAO|nr:hypothetical protein [Marixanthomonas ophiurae]RFN59808.1 hypothetical protein DZ858_07085 [Marixanthomonas ophiurae]
MEHKEDIGTLFERKLQNKKVKPKSNLWKKIDVSLTQRAKKQKKTYWSWGVVTGILIIAGIVFSSIISESNDKPPKQSNSLAAPIQDNFKTDKKPTISKVDSVEKEVTKNVIDTTSKNLNNLDKTTINTADRKSSEFKEIRAEKDFDSFRKKTVYRYYNSKDSTTIETTNKALIDSIVTLDTINVKIDSTN